MSKKTQDMLDDILLDAKKLRDDKLKLLEICSLLAQKVIPENEIVSFNRMLWSEHFNVLIKFLKDNK